MRKILAIIAALFLTTGVALAVSVPSAVAAGGPHGATYLGPLRPSDNPHWCITAPADPKLYDTFRLLPCVQVKGKYVDKWQIFECSEVLGAGSCQLVYATQPSGLFLGWKGKKGGYYVWTINPALFGSGDQYIFNFSKYEKGQLIFFSTVDRFVTAPVHIKKGQEPFVRWLKGASSAKQNQEWLISWTPVS